MPYQKKKQTRYNRRRLFGALPAPLTRTRRAVSYGPPANATSVRPMAAPRPRPLGRDGQPISKERQKAMLKRWADRNGPGPWVPNMVSGPATAVETAMNAAEVKKKTRTKTKTAVEPETHPTGTGQSKRVGVKQKPPTNVWIVALDNVQGDPTPKRDYKARTTTTTVRSVSPIVGDKYCVSHRLLTPRSRRLRQKMKLNGLSTAKIRSEMSNRTFYNGQSTLFADAALDWPSRKTVTRAGLNECALHQTVTVPSPTWPLPNYAVNGFYPTTVLPTWAFLAGDYNAMFLQDAMRALWANGIGGTSVPQKSSLKMILPATERTLAVEVMNRSSYTDLEVHIALFRNFTDNYLTLAQRVGTAFIDPSRYLYSTGTTFNVSNDNFTDSAVTYSDGLSLHRDWYPTLSSDIIRDDYEMVFHDVFVLAPHDVARVSTTVEMNGFDVLEFDRRVVEIASLTPFNKSFCMAGDYQYLIWANGRPSMVNAVYRRYLPGPPETAKILPDTLERMSAPVEYTVKCELSCSVADRTWFSDKDTAVGAYGWDATTAFWALDATSNTVANINSAIRALDRRLRAIDLFDAVRKDRPLLPMEHSATVLDISPDKWSDISIKDSGWVVPVNVEVRTTSATYSVTDSKP